MVSQVGVATPTPTASVTAGNATTTGSGPAETNPSLLPTSTSTAGDGSTGSSSDPIAGWSKPVKIGVGAAVGAIFVAIIVLGSLCHRKRKYGMVYGYSGEYDEYGNRVPGYTAGYESYRRADRPTENNVTVNVVQGDMQNS